MAVAAAAAALSAAPVLVCFTASVRITVTPDHSNCSLGAYGPLLPAPVVIVPGIIDGVYST